MRVENGEGDLEPQILRNLSCDRFLARAWHALDMALQPIVTTQTAKVFGYEALMRGHDVLGFDTIAAVLDTAAKLGVADKLYLLLLEKALRKFRDLGDVEGTKLFLNLDGRALQGDVPIEEQTIQLLDHHGLPASALCLEFSETFNYASAMEVAGLVAKLRTKGVLFAIDDFGQGFSELKVLYEYHPDYIKIDRFFVTGMIDDDRKRLFVSTVINLAHVLGIGIVVEGVETEQEYELCLKLGSDFVQGFFVSYPRLDYPNGHETYPHVEDLLPKLRSAPTSDDTFVHEHIEDFATLVDSSNADQLFNAFRSAPDQLLIPIVNAQNEPRGVVLESTLKEYIYSRFGRELLRNNSFKRQITDFMHQCPIADINLSAPMILDIFAYQPNSGGVILTENGKYAGFLSARTLLEIMNDKRLERARDQNPLSKLPGNTFVLRETEKIVTATRHDRFLCYFDFDNFKPFNDCYGFQMGDRAITIFANLLQKHFSDASYKLGHIGGDDFFLGVIDARPSEMEKKLLRVKERFAKAAEGLYSRRDIERGHIYASDRFGNKRRFPLLNVSVAMLAIEADTQLRSTDAVLRHTAQIKTQAKHSPEGVAFVRYADLVAPLHNGRWTSAAQSV